jgi:Sec7-like guanine-nucleotide exchange factor
MFSGNMKSLTRIVAPLQRQFRSASTTASLRQAAPAVKFDPEHTRTEAEETSTRYEQRSQPTPPTSDKYVYKKVEQKLPEVSPLYLDQQATGPVDPRVLDAMLPYLLSQFGNPHSRSHSYGWESELAMETARQQVASLIGADPKEIIYTSGATESNNLAIKGIARFYKEKKKHIITTQTV